MRDGNGEHAHICAAATGQEDHCSCALHTPSASSTWRFAVTSLLLLLLLRIMFNQVCQQLAAGNSVSQLMRAQGSQILLLILALLLLPFLLSLLVWDVGLANIVLAKVALGPQRLSWWPVCGRSMATIE